MAEFTEQRLSKLAKEYSIGVGAISSFLKRNGHHVDNNPNAKISGDLVALVANEFQSEKARGEEAAKITARLEALKNENNMLAYDNEMQSNPHEDTDVTELYLPQKEINNPLTMTVAELAQNINVTPEILINYFEYIKRPIPHELDFVLSEELIKSAKENKSSYETKNAINAKNNIEEGTQEIIYKELANSDFQKIEHYETKVEKLEGPKVLGQVDLSLKSKSAKPIATSYTEFENKKERKRILKNPKSENRNKLNNLQNKKDEEAIQFHTKESTEVISKVKSDNEKFVNLINEETILKINPMEQLKTPVQKIIFGSPGTGKSYTISGKGNPHSYLKQLGINDEDDPNCIKTVFHPEYTYGDFMGKLLPLTDDADKITYNFYEGHFLQALAQAFQNYINNDDGKIQNVLLVIDEINRGNSAAIFGTAFQLLDRDKNGFSEYEISISKMEYDRLITLVFPELKEIVVKERQKKIEKKLKDNKELSFLITNKIKIPPNLHIIATMNTSDNSIYFMDSAFKRRWDWQFIDVTSPHEKENQKNRRFENGDLWSDFVDNINEFIKTKCKIRKIEDKQIGYYFIKGDIISKYDIENKLMFFLWDSVFNNEKRPLVKLLNLNPNDLVTFGDFVKNTQRFIDAIKLKTYNKVTDE